MHQIQFQDQQLHTLEAEVVVKAQVELVVEEQVETNQVVKDQLELLTQVVVAVVELHMEQMVLQQEDQGLLLLGIDINNKCVFTNFNK